MTERRTIGAPLPRREDYRFLTGQGRYLDDIAVPNCLHAHLFARRTRMRALFRSTSRPR
jgi:aerobic carbon-monoxide dehydrogenase large subunit